MTLSSYELIEINSVVIIGLTIFLSFQSITSAFIENDMLTFFETLRDDFIKFEELEHMLGNCKIVGNQTNAEAVAYTLGEYVNYDTEFGKNLTDSTMKKFQENCSDYAIERIQLKEKLLASQSYGLKIGYLENNTENKEAIKNDEIVSTSEWFKEVASGPIQVIIVNLVMVMPFAVSAIIELVYSNSKEPGNSASKMGLSITIGGFVVVVIGFLIIGYFFIKANILFS